MPAPVMNHLWPRITQAAPRFSARVRIMAGSEPPPGAGSVMAKEERTLPSTIGLSHFSCCAGVPARASRFMLPSSGAAQLNASGPKIERLASSYMAAQRLGRLRRPQPGRLGLGLNAAQHVETDVFVIVIVRRVRLEPDDMLFDE